MRGCEAQRGNSLLFRWRRESVTARFGLQIDQAIGGQQVAKLNSCVLFCTLERVVRCQYVGSSSGCGCDFPHATFQGWGWPERDYQPEGQKDELDIARENSEREIARLLLRFCEPRVTTWSNFMAYGMGILRMRGWLPKRGIWHGGGGHRDREGISEMRGRYGLRRRITMAPMAKRAAEVAKAAWTEMALQSAPTSRLDVKSPAAFTAAKVPNAMPC